MKEQFERYGAPTYLRSACDDVERELSLLPVSSGTFGLIHYDFEPDNVLYDDETGSFGVIDPDDAIRCWYALDVARAIDAMDDVVEEDEVDAAAEAFLEGYRSKRAFTRAQAETMPLMRKLVMLQEYATILHVTDEKLENEPGWMQDVRRKLDSRLADIRASFPES